MPGQGRGPMTWISVGLVGVVFSGSVWWWTSEQNEAIKKRQQTKLDPGFGKPDIGGPFELIDVNGKKRTEKDFLGKYMLIYFGFTYCPDICPNELMRMAQIITSVEKDLGKDKMQPLFITIDPERDGPKQLKTYLEDWHPRMIGLTGTPEQIAKACKAYRVYASKSMLGSGPGEYLIDHSIMFYLMDDKGNFVDYFGKALSGEDIAVAVKKYITGTADDKTHRDDSLSSKDAFVVK